MKLGDLLKARREQAGLSLQDLADATGVTKSHLWEVEDGRTVNIGLVTSIRISIALGVPVNVLAAAALESANDKPTRLAARGEKGVQS